MSIVREDLQFSAAEAPETESKKEPEKPLLPAVTAEHPVIGNTLETLDRSKTISIQIPAKISGDEMRQIMAALPLTRQEEDTMARLEERAFVPLEKKPEWKKAPNVESLQGEIGEKIKRTQRGIEEDALNLALARTSQMDAGRLVQSSVEDREGVIAALSDKMKLERKYIEQQTKAHPQAYEIRTVLTETSTLLENLRQNGVEDGVLQQLEIQMNAVLTKSLSDRHLRNFEGDPSIGTTTNKAEQDLGFQGTQEMNIVLETAAAMKKVSREEGATGIISSAEYQINKAKLESQLLSVISAFNQEPNTPKKKTSEEEDRLVSVLATIDNDAGLEQKTFVENSPNEQKTTSALTYDTKSIPLSKSAQAIFRRVRGGQIFEDFHQEALEHHEFMKQTDKHGLDLTVERPGHIPLRVVKGKGIERSTKKGDLMIGRDLTEIGVESLVQSTNDGFELCELPTGALKEKVEGFFNDRWELTQFGEKFVSAVDQSVKTKEGMRFLADLDKMGHGLNFIEEHAPKDPTADEKGIMPKVTKNDVVRIFMAARGKLAALTANPDFDLEIGAPVNALPEDRSKADFEGLFSSDVDRYTFEISQIQEQMLSADQRGLDPSMYYEDMARRATSREVLQHQAEIDAAANFSESLDFLLAAAKEYYRQPDPSEQAALNMSLAFAKTFLAQKACDEAGVVAMPPIHGKNEKLTADLLSVIQKK